MKRAIVGDSHIGMSCIWTQDEILDKFEDIVKQAIQAGCEVLYQVGDMFSDTQLSNEQLRRVTSIIEGARKCELRFEVLRGNHDSTRTYSTTPVIDVIGEHDNVWLCPAFIPTVHEGVLFIPHMKSQTDFTNALDVLIASERSWSMILMHCAIEPPHEGGPNDMSIDMGRLKALASKAGSVFIGHEHVPAKFLDNVYRVGSTMPFSFGELGQRYWYEVENNIVLKHEIAQPRPMVELRYTWPFNVQEVIAHLDDQAIFKLRLYEVPASEYKNVRIWMDTLPESVIWEIHKVGEKSIETIKSLEAHLDIREEFQLYLKESGLEGEAADDMTTRLDEALREVELEEALYTEG